ncbi:hypothetical protein QYE76_041162 [Lolium multiflorum]|uniref:Uncharacterized protein n=1 Tax=Lolium multiflorum TaxID=4521 RepID=A0AAD8WTW3_LOLMU|nr:hypothetical protein QYE76_041162 [Lolium multiflorum]
MKQVVTGFVSSSSFRSYSLCVAPASSTAYLTYNTIALAHLTVNQTILDANASTNPVHMIDVHAAHGVQWPPFLQATCDRADSNLRAHLRLGSPALATAATCSSAPKPSTCLRNVPRPRILLPPTAQLAADPVTTLVHELHLYETLAVNCRDVPPQTFMGSVTY